MHLSVDKIKQVCRRQGLRLRDLLKKARVSPTAYYSLVRKESVLPGSILAIARALDVAPTDLLQDEIQVVRKRQGMVRECEQILKKHPSADRDNVLHTCLLLEESPEERLNRALQRGTKIHPY